jgi:ethanolamine ammonia-lyase small subunit
MTRRPLAVADPWRNLRSLTTARIALGRAGGSLTTDEWLDFRAAHAAARDAVWSTCDWPKLQAAVQQLGLAAIPVHSAARDRAEYVKRPDLGRQLDPPSRAVLADVARPPEGWDLVLVVADGLSAQAVDSHAVAVLAALAPRLRDDGWQLAPVVLAQQARVALQDEIGALLQCRLALSLIGERPGLDAPDSLGAYLAYDPRPGRTNADRNCVSNIRTAGLAAEAAAEALLYLLHQARRQRLSGVALKDLRTAAAPLPPPLLPDPAP